MTSSVELDRQSSIGSVPSKSSLEDNADDLVEMLDTMRLKDDVSVEKTQEKDVLLIDGKFPEKSHFSCKLFNNNIVDDLYLVKE